MKTLSFQRISSALELAHTVLGLHTSLYVEEPMRPMLARRPFLNALLAVTVVASGALAACAVEEEAVGEGGAAVSSDEGLDTAVGEAKLPGEDESVEKAKAMVREMMVAKQRQMGQAEPANHATLQGCMRAEFTVLDVKPELAVGMFEAAGQYPAWVQFSNADGVMSGRKGADDRESVLRGVAIKVMGVRGPRIESGQAATTQDFLMNNRPYFYWKNINVMTELLGIVRQHGVLSKVGAVTSTLFHHTPRENIALIKAIKEGLANDKSDKNVIDNQLTERYWSRLPVSFGAGQAIKYGMWPRACDDAPWDQVPNDVAGDPTHPNVPSDLEGRFLRAAAKKTMSERDVCFDFAVQRQTSPETMPVEDEGVRWTPEKSPYRVVARLRIPKQNFDRPDRNEFCSHLTFAPFNGRAEHRPLGNLNRGRHEIEQLSSKFRHDAEGVPEREPIASEGPISLD